VGEKPHCCDISALYNLGVKKGTKKEVHFMSGVDIE
jgi:hypothetical protein